MTTKRAMPDLLREPPKNRPAWVRTLLLAGAALAFLVGIAGWLVPVVTGVPFFIVGLVLLGTASGRFRGWINRGERRMSEKWRKRLRRGLHKVPSKRLRAMVCADSAA